MNKQKPNLWLIISILLIIVTALLSAMIISKMSYSAGYEDGKNGIITMLQIQRQTGNPIITMNNNEMNKELKRFVYFLNSWNYKK